MAAELKRSKIKIQSLIAYGMTQSYGPDNKLYYSLTVHAFKNLLTKNTSNVKPTDIEALAHHYTKVDQVTIDTHKFIDDFA